MHDQAVSQDGTYDRAVAAIAAAKARGFRVCINTTLFDGAEPERVAAFLDDVTAIGIDGVMISPGYAYERAPDRAHFLNRQKSKQLFRDIFRAGRGRGWKFNQSSLFLDFLAGNQRYLCTPWGKPTRNVFGWQRPCYLLGEGYATTYAELMETTDWDKYGTGNYEKCADCMVHSGYEATAVVDAVRKPLEAAAGGAARAAHRGADGAGDPAGGPAPGRIRVQPARAAGHGEAARTPSPRAGRRRSPRSPTDQAARTRPLQRRPRGGGVAAEGDQGRHLSGVRAPPRPARAAGRSRRAGSSATSAAGGSVRPAGSQIARSTANGRPCRAATRATAPLSRSMATAPVLCEQPRLLRRLGHHRRAREQRAAGRAEPGRQVRVGGVHGLALAHARRHHHVAGRSAGSSPPARPKLTSPSTPGRPATRPPLPRPPAARRRPAPARAGAPAAPRRSGR